MGFSDCTSVYLQLLCLGLDGQDCTTVAVIQAGDSCSAIADNAGIPVTTLLVNNPNVNSECSNIYPGEVRRHFHLHCLVLTFSQVLCTASQIFNYS